MNHDLLQQIYRQYQSELYLYLYGLCYNCAQAEDLMQDTFLKALLSLPDRHPNFRAWLYMVAHNLFLDHFRKERRVKELDETQLSVDAELSTRLIADETRSMLYKAMKALEPKKREVLLLQYFSNLPQKEIALVLHLTPEYVRVLSSRGKRELKQRMEELGYEV